MKPLQRYRAMARNRGRTGPERALASGLWRRGLRYFTHGGYRSATGKRLLGNPDLVFPRKRILIFVDGCFWHGCPKCGKHVGLKEESWVNKIQANIERDCRITAALENDGWTVHRVPEHAIRRKEALLATVNDVAQCIRLSESKVTAC